MTHNAEDVAAVEYTGEPDVVVMPDEIYDDGDDNVVYINDDDEEAKFLMGVLNYDDAG